jgi:hypothetical protein
LNAIDLNTGKYLWKIPFGAYPELAAQGMKSTGTENYGGPIVTAGGVLFIGATIFDRKMHAFDGHTGKLLWETALPFPGHATPATYMIDGKQYVVIAAGGRRDPKWSSGGVYVAFALPAHRADSPCDKTDQFSFAVKMILAHKCAGICHIIVTCPMQLSRCNKVAACEWRAY